VEVDENPVAREYSEPEQSGDTEAVVGDDGGCGKPEPQHATVA
jgi:hypothetical protein